MDIVRGCLAVLAVCTVGALSACGGGDGSSAQAHTLKGTVTFDKVPSTTSGLDYAGVTERPLRGVDVAAVDASNPNTVLASGVTDGTGAYSLGWTGISSVKLVVFARTHAPKISVVDNTSDGVVWVLTTDAIDTGSTSSASFNAASGWTGTAYASRSAAPFAVLDAATEAVLAFQAARPAAAFPDLTINWSPKNAPVDALPSETQEQAYAAGRIGTSHWNGTALYILGKENVDTDEFDDHVIVHEWGHYFETTLGRSDSVGGSHGPGDIKDPRVALSEGWGNALSAMVWSPNTVYSDASGVGQASGFGFDLEDNVSFDPTPGWYSEASVQSILFDLFDSSGGSEAFDTVALGLGPIYDVQVGGEKTTPALTTLFSFINALKLANPGQAAAIDTLTQHRGVVVNPILDDYGSTEVNGSGNNAGSNDNLPVYRTLTVNTSEVANLVGGEFNDLAQNRYFRFTGDGASHTVSISTTPLDKDADVLVARAGEVVASAVSSSGTESTPAFTALNNVVYIVVITGYAASGSYQTTVVVDP